MKRFTNAYKSIIENININNKSLVRFIGDPSACPTNIKDIIKQTFQNYIISDKIQGDLYLNVIVEINRNLILITCQNINQSINTTSTTNQQIIYNQTPTTAQHLFNKLCQSLIDQFDQQNIKLEEIIKKDDILGEDFTLFLVSDDFIK